MTEQQPPPPGSIVITPKEFYDGVRQDIADIKAAVSPLPNLVEVNADHERRLGKVERLIWLAVGASLASGGADFYRFVS